MLNKIKSKQAQRDIWGKYRHILKNPHLTDQEIDEMRSHLSLIAQTICEHIWGKKFY